MISARMKNLFPVKLLSRKLSLLQRNPLQPRDGMLNKSFISHLKIHGLPGNCSQINVWYHQSHENIIGCGFCHRYFKNINERMLHVANRFEEESTRDEWELLYVVLSLMSQLHTAYSWTLQQSVESIGQETKMTWTKNNASELQ